MFLLIVFAVLGLIYSYVKWISFTYWRRRGIYSPEPTFPFGNFKRIICGQQYGGLVYAEFYKDAKARQLKHFGTYTLTNATYVPIDPDILKHIFVKDFNHFADRGVYLNETADPLTGHLFALEYQKWRKLRTKLSPTFSSGKMKMMFNIIKECGDEMINVMEHVRSSGEPIDTKDILARLTTDVIGNCAFGIECNSLKNPEVKFRKVGSQVFSPTMAESVKADLLDNYTGFAKFFSLKVIQNEVSEFFINLTNEVVNYREKNNVERNDFLNLLIRLKNNRNLDDDKLNDNEETTSMTNLEVAAQSFVFFVAGFETSSSTMTFCLYELSKNQEIQDKLRHEIKEELKKTNGVVTYELIMGLQYLDKVVNETLRKYPTIGFLPRICTETYKVPDTDLVLEKGTRVIIPVYGIHHDPDYYPDPEIFDPERFNDENKAKRPNYTFLPFGEGPRICIGMRFGLMQVKIGLVEILSNYKVILNSKTQEPLQFITNSLVFGAKNVIYLNLEKLYKD